MAATNPRVDAYIRKAPAFARPILAHLRQLVHESCPEVEETIKWSHQLPGSGETANPANQFGRLASIDDLPRDRELKKIIKAAAKLNDDGVKAPPMRKGPRPELKAPKDLLQVIARSAHHDGRGVDGRRQGAQLEVREVM